MMSRKFATVVTLVIVVAFVVVAVAPAFAAPPSLVLHARLSSSAPKDGATVKTATEVVLTFNEDVNPNFVKVEVGGPDGDETDGDPTTDAGTVTQTLTGDLPAGDHTVTYRVVSTDGHPVSGTVTFTTTAAPASASPSPSATESATAAPSPTASAVASPEPSVTTAPVSDESGSGGTAWLVVAVLVLLAVLGLGAAWRTIGGPKTDAEADAADVADDEAPRA